jgi:hypothetical protein
MSEKTDTRNIIIEQIRQLARDGRAPGRERFFAEAKISEYQLTCHFRTYSDAVIEAGFEPNKFSIESTPKETLLQSLAQLTLEIGHFPTLADLRIARRQKGGKFPSPEVFQKRLGVKAEMIQSLVEWAGQTDGFEAAAALAVQAQSEHSFPRKLNQSTPDETASLLCLSDSFLPPIVAPLDELSRATPEAIAACESSHCNINSEFERRVAIAFRLLDLDVQRLGQGQGRNPDGIAKHFQRHWAVIYDAKVRSGDYRLLTEDERKFREYIERSGEGLAKQGITRFYFAVVSSHFLQRDLQKAQELCRITQAKACVFIEASALQSIIEKRLSAGSAFSEDELERYFAETRILR